MAGMGLSLAMRVGAWASSVAAAIGVFALREDSTFCLREDGSFELRE